MTSARGSLLLPQALLAGASLGLAECFLTAATGRLQRHDLAWIWAFDLALVSLGALAASVVRALLRAWIAPWVPSCLIVAGPSALLAIRGRLTEPDRWISPSGLAAVGLLALPFVLIRLVWLRNKGSLPLHVYAAAAGATLAMSAFVLSDDLVPGIGGPGRAVAAVATAGALAAVWWTVSSRRARAAGGASVARAVALATTLGVGGGQLLVRSPEIGASRVAAPARSELGAPNILLVTLDAVRRDHVSCYGYSRPTTPSIDALARGATLYRNAYANSPYTLSSHASLFTGLLPSAHGAHPVPFSHVGRAADTSHLALSTDHETLAEYLGRRGYRTGAISANYGHLRAGSGLDQGFDDYDARAERIHGHVPLLQSALLLVGPAVSPRLFLPWTKASREAAIISDAAIEWISRAGEQPFLLFLNYVDAHSPYAPPPEYSQRFDTGYPLLVQLRWNRGRALSGRDWRLLIAQYDAAIAYVDNQLGRVLAFLAASGRHERTLIVVTSDHGEFLGEHGLRGHGQALFEPVLRIPLIVKRPGERTGRAEDRLTTLADLHWLIREVAEPSAAGDSADALGARVVAEYWVPAIEHRNNPLHCSSPALRAVYRGAHKLIQASSGRLQLFDLASDPAEQADLARTAERAWLASELLRGHPPLLEWSPGRARPVRNPDAEQRLRALGYAR